MWLRQPAAEPAGPPVRNSRSGLAPLELILCLPLLLTILALIIDLGIEVKWKIRALAVSRQAVWRQRPDRKGASDPQPAGWPTKNTTLRVIPAPAPPLFSQDPFAQNTVVRGPVLRDPIESAQSQLLVDTDLFDISGKVEQGNATVDRQFPLLPKFPGVHLNVDHLLADGLWRSQDMGIPNGDLRGPRDEWRRIRRIYKYIPPDNVTNLAQQYQQAATAIISFPSRSSLAVLDRDDELFAWYGVTPQNDFHPSLRPVYICPDSEHCGCTLNRFMVHSGVLKDLIDRVQGPEGGGKGGVPWQMANRFISMYESQVAQLKQQIPPDQAKINAIEKLIQQLQSFKGTLH